MFVEDLKDLPSCPPCEAREPNDGIVFVRIHKGPQLEADDYLSNWTALPEKRQWYFDKGYSECSIKAVSLIVDDNKAIHYFIKRHKGKLGRFASRIELSPTDGKILNDNDWHISWWVSSSFDSAKVKNRGVQYYAANKV